MLHKVNRTLSIAKHYFCYLYNPEIDIFWFQWIGTGTLHDTELLIVLLGSIIHLSERGKERDLAASSMMGNYNIRKSLVMSASHMFLSACRILQYCNMYCVFVMGCKSCNVEVFGHEIFTS